MTTERVAASAEPAVDPQRPPDPTVVSLRRERNPLKVFTKILGPGLVTGASDDDPSGIGTYAQAGAAYGYATLWTTVVMLPMMISVQYICAKIGLVNGRGLAGVLHEHYPRWVLCPAVLALVVANTINAGVDIGAITLHPSGLPHGPQPGVVEKALGTKSTDELAVMCDTFKPLKLTTLSRDLDDPSYALSWYEEDASMQATTIT